MAELSPAQRRALRTVAEIAAHEIKGDVLSGLVKAGLAIKVVDRVAAHFQAALDRAGQADRYVD